MKNIILTIYHFLSLFIKSMIILVLFPLWLLLVYIKGIRYRIIFEKELNKYGLDKKSVKQLKKETLKIRDLLKFTNK